MQEVRPPSASDGDPLYRAAGFFLLRAPVLPVQDFLAITSGPEPRDAAAGHDDAAARLERTRRHGRKLLRDAASRPRVAQALHIASGSVTAGLERLGESPEDGRRARRTYSTLLRYLTRMSTRSTPYGLFSGVAAGVFTDTAGLAMAADPVARTRTRADLGWFLALLKELENDPAVRAQLPARINSALYRVGERGVLPGADVYGEEDNRLAGFRMTEPAELAMRLARLPGTTYADILDSITATVPGATPDKAEAFLAQLWDLHALTGDLRPSLVDPHPEVALAKALTGLDAAAPVLERLRATRRLADRVDSARGTAPVSALRDLADHQRSMVPGYAKETFQLDTELAVTGTGLPKEIGDAAASAAEALLRMGSFPSRPQHIAEYHSAFLERFGVDSEIPLLQVLSPETGIDAPNSYTNPARAFPLPPVGEDRALAKETRLAALVAETLWTGASELEITDERLEQLSVWQAGERQPRVRPALDLYAQIAAESPQALRDDDWRLVLAPAGMAEGGRTFGRFFDLLDDGTLQRLRQYARAEEDLCPDAVFADLNYTHPHGRSNNVALHPGLRRYEICVNTTPTLPTDRQIPLSDILVGATANRFFLRSARLGKELVVSQGHMLSALQAPNICRLLLELSEDGYAPLAGFDWGSQRMSPFLPRVTRGRTVLHPAQWSLTPERLGLSTGKGALPDRDAFYAAVQRWRERWNVPRHVSLMYMDNWLALDLEHPLCVDELYDEVAALSGADRQHVIVQEALTGFPRTWLRDPAGGQYLNEVVVPLLARDPGRCRRSAVPAAAARTAPAADSSPLTDLAVPTSPRAFPPGSEWTYLKLYCAVDAQDDVVAGPLRELVEGLRSQGAVDRWFFLRYADPMPHLRIRFRAARPELSAPVLAACLEWAHGLISAGLAHDVAVVGYDREVERYGGPEAMDAVERVFQVNSEVCAELVAARRHGGVETDSELMCVLGMHALYRDWGLDPLELLPPPAARRIPESSRKHFRRVQRELCDLLVPWDAHPAPMARTYGYQLEVILSRQSEVLSEVGGRIRSLASASRLMGDEQQMLASLAHMHANRFLGLGEDRERLCHDLWILAAEAIRRRPVTHIAPPAAGGDRG
ncbi:lantibiotic dehydratase [Streptomyces sp. NPDC088254]|uniref:lantibiotic dehydratase n=1 Tax=Streptomyces sp. NPDC088254 TaxID=3365847 RepID=UPI00382D3181